MRWELARALVIVLCIVLSIPSVGFGVEGPSAASPEGPAASRSPVQLRELQLYQRVLTGPNMSSQDRLEAAMLLLQRRSPQAQKILLEALADSANPPAQVAVAMAIAQSLIADKPGAGVFIGPLFEALASKDNKELRKQASIALAGFRNHGVLQRLEQVAKDHTAAQSYRLAAVATIERLCKTDKQAIRALIEILDSDDEAVRNAAAEALKAHTGHDLGTDKAKWEKVWGRLQNMRLTDYLAQQLQELERQQRQTQLQLQWWTQRALTELEKRYRSADEARQQQILTEALLDAEPQIRGKALELLHEWPGLGKQVPKPLIEQLRRMIDESQPENRLAVIKLLRDCRDVDSAPLLLKRLNVEPVAAVQAAIVDALGKFESFDAIRPLLELLNGAGDRQVRIESAAAVGQIAARGRLQQDQSLRAAVRQVLEKSLQSCPQDDSELRAALLEAMGRIADPALAPLIEKYLDKQTPPAELVAAIRAYSSIRGAGGVDVLLKAGLLAHESPVVRKEVISVLNRYGRDSELPVLFAKLSEAAEPVAENRQLCWQAVQKLLSAADIKTLALWQKRFRTAAHESAREQAIIVTRMLLDKLKTDPATKPEQLRAVKLELAEMLSKAGKYELAVGIYSPLFSQLAAAKDPASAEVGERLLSAQLAAGQVQPAAEVLAKLAGELAAADAAAERLLQWAEQALNNAAELESVATIVALAGEQLNGKISRENQTKLAVLSRRAAEALLVRLRSLLASATPDRSAEKRLTALLARLDGRLKGYPLQAGRAEKLKLLKAWQKQLTGG